MPTITGVSHIDLSVTDLDRSEQWYSELFSMQKVLDGRNDDQHFDSRYLVHPDSMLIIGLVVHDEAASKEFDEHAVGLDHLSLNVASREELDAWQQHLAARNIAHSPIAEGELWDVLVLRDPDNIQLELFYMKPAAGALLTA
jgi:catechol-2,3-dioxygenase